MKGSRFELKEIHSGEDTGGVWVSLGFSSDARELDVLHIACGKDQSPCKTPADNGLYFERFDQAYSCSGRATGITVGPATIRLAFSPTEARALGFHGLVTFIRCASVAGFDKSVATFRAVAQHNRGRNVIVRIPSNKPGIEPTQGE